MIRRLQCRLHTGRLRVRTLCQFGRPNESEEASPSLGQTKDVASGSTCCERCEGRRAQGKGGRALPCGFADCRRGRARRGGGDAGAGKGDADAGGADNGGAGNGEHARVQPAPIGAPAIGLAALTINPVDGVPAGSQEPRSALAFIEEDAVVGDIAAGERAGDNAAGELAHAPPTSEALVASAVGPIKRPLVTPALLPAPTLTVIAQTPDDGLVLGRHTAGVCVPGEDSAANEDGLLHMEKLRASAVCDGHREDGAFVARAAARAIGDSLFRTARAARTMTPEGRLRRAIADAVERVKGDPRADVSGTTASIALVDDGRVHLANVGDSSVFLNATALTEDHILDSNVEKEHVKPTEEELMFGRLTERGVRASLAVTRAIGDQNFTRASSEPHIASVAVKPGDILIVASDGVWDAHYGYKASDVVTQVAGLVNESGGGAGIADNLKRAAAVILDRCRGIPITRDADGVVVGGKRIIPPRDDLALIISLPAGPR